MSPTASRKIDATLARVGCTVCDERADWLFLRAGMCALASLIALSSAFIHLV